MRNVQRVLWRAAVLAGGLASGCALAASAQDASGMQGNAVPDAQVEANVLRQLASAPELSKQNIQTSTVYGTVTLTGNVHDEAMRTQAENLASRAQGVKKVVDELTLGDAPASAAGTEQYSQAPGADQAAPAGEVLQSDGTYAPAPGGNPSAATGDVPAPGQSTYPAQPGYPGAPEYGNQSGAPGPNATAGGQGYGSQPNGAYQQPQNGQAYGNGQGYPNQQSYPDQNQQYGNQQYGNQQAYGTQPPPPGYGRRPMYSNGYAQQPGYPPVRGGQVGGQQVTVPAGTPLQVRVDRGFDANHVQPGTPFTGTVMQDIVADGAIAIPRGATVQGVVVDAKKAGVLKGSAELALQINGLTLGGQQFALASEVWGQEGRDKTNRTVNSALGFGALGAIVGAVAGGGAGAAIGAGVGAGAGVASSAGTPSNRVIVPAEAVLPFQLAQPATVITVGQSELSRLNYAAGPPARPAPRRYPPYYGPGYYYR